METEKRIEKVICHYNEDVICGKQTRGQPYDCSLCGYYNDHRRKKHQQKYEQKETIEPSKEYLESVEYFTKNEYIFSMYQIDFLTQIMFFKETYNSLTLKQQSAFIATVNFVKQNEIRLRKMYGYRLKK